MIQNKLYLISLFFAAILVISIIGVIADDQIRPAPQTESRGIGEQIRPANQQSLPTDGNGGYSPSEGSSYSSSDKPLSYYDVTMNAELNNAGVNNTSNATGNASFVLNTKENTLNYDIEYSNLSSNETSAEIIVTDVIVNDMPVSYTLSLGEIKRGVISFAKEVESYILEGKALIKIRSLLFPEGEFSGQIRII